MPRGHISLNSKGYVVVPRRVNGRLVPVEEYDVPAFGTPFRTQGVQQQDQIVTYSSRTFGPFTGGFGRDRIPAQKANDPSQYRRFFDSTVDTRFDLGAFLSRSSAAATILTDGEVIRASCQSGVTGAIALHAFWDRDGTNKGVVAGIFNGTSWNNSSTTVVDSANETVVIDAIDHKDRIVLLCWHTNDLLTRFSTDGSSWTAPTTEIPANMVTTASANADNDVGRLVEIGGEIVAVVHHQNNNTVTFMSSSNAAVDWVDENVDVPGGGVLGAAVYPGIDDADKLYVLTPFALWEVDTSPSTWTTTKVLNSTRAGNTAWANRLAVHGGKLWIGMGADDDTPASVATLSTVGGVREIDMGMGLDQGDGVPSDLLGAPRWLLSAGRFLYMAVGGGVANRNARILCHNGEGWHHIHQNSTTNQDIEWMEFSSLGGTITERLHFAVRTGTNTVTTNYISNPNANPGSGSDITFAYQASGILDLPEIDGGMPTIDGPFLQVRVGAADVSSDTDGDYINVDYATDGATRGGTNLGDILSGTKKLDWASGAGVEGTSMALRMNLHRDSGDTDESPVLRSAEIDYLKQPGTVEGFTFTVDLGATAKLQGTTPENVLTNLKAARDLGTLPALDYGPSGTKYVKVRRVQWFVEFQGTSRAAPTVAADSLMQRAGYADITCEQVIT